MFYLVEIWGSVNGALEPERLRTPGIDQIRRDQIIRYVQQQKVCQTNPLFCPHL